MNVKNHLISWKKETAPVKIVFVLNKPTTTNKMKTLKFELQTIFAKQFTGHPSRKEEHDIKQIKEAILKLAQAIDNIHEYLTTIR